MPVWVSYCPPDYLNRRSSLGVRLVVFQHIEGQWGEQGLRCSEVQAVGCHGIRDHHRGPSSLIDAVTSHGVGASGVTLYVEQWCM